MRFRGNFLATIVILVICFRVAGQSSALNSQLGVNIISPSASSLGKYIDVPVDLHTGIPSIDIPIYAVREGNIQLPISLSYHASGLKVMEVASWVGIGWSLNAGGVISRTVRGLPDDQVGSLNSSGGSVEGSFYRDGGFSEYFAEPDVFNPVDITNFQQFGAGQKDGEPDMFYFNFGSYSGQFYINEDQKPVLLPASDLSIELILKSGGLTYGVLDYFQGFKITTPDGTKYYFGLTENNELVGDDPIEETGVSSSDNITTYSRVISSWYLHKIESLDGSHEINLSYEEENYGYYTISTAPCVPDCNDKIVPIKMLFKGARLSTITTSNVDIQFVPSATPREDLSSDVAPFNPDLPNTEAKSLQEIQISSLHSDFCKSFVFSHDYFESSEAPANLVPGIAYTYDQKRLKLDAVEELDCSGNLVKPPYTFDYYQPSQVPRRLSFAQDHWGFFNGASANQTLLPSYSTNNETTTSAGDAVLGSGIRDPAFPEMRAGSLKSITYPEGGSTTFSYQSNEVKTFPIGCTDGTPITSNLIAGLGTLSAEFGDIYTLQVQEQGAFRFHLYSEGGGSGSLYLDGQEILVNDGSSSSVNYVRVLDAGNYQIQSYANSDGTSGTGVRGEVISCSSSSIQLVGGLRIASITHDDPAGGVPIVKSYSYEDPQLYNVPRYVFKLKNAAMSSGISHLSTLYDSECWFNTPGSYSVQVRTSPANTHPLQGGQGYHIGYGKVVETQGDGGYTQYSFSGQTVLPAGWSALRDVSVRSVDRNVCLPDDPVFPFVPLPYDFNRGKLISKSYYDVVGSLLRQEEFSYTYEPLPEVTFAVSAQVIASIGSLLVTEDGAEEVTNNVIVPHFYEMRSERLVESTQQVRSYDPDDVTNYQSYTSTTRFDGVGHNQATSTVTLDDVIGEEKEEIKYASDLTACRDAEFTSYALYLINKASLDGAYQTQCDLCDAGNYSVVCNDLVNIHSNNLQSCDEGVLQCRLAAYFQYHYDLNELRKTYVSDLQSHDDGRACTTTGLLTPNPTGALYWMERNNQIGQPVETRISRNGKVMAANYYEYQAYGSGDVHLDKVYTFENAFGVTDFVPAAISGNSIQIDADYSPIPEVDLKFDNGQVVERIDRNGVITAYLWGYNNTVPIVVAVGVNHNTLKQAYDADPTDFRNNNSLSGAQITTYTHDPVLGITSETGPNGITRIYSYDRLGRLEQIRDQDQNVLTHYEYNY